MTRYDLIDNIFSEERVEDAVRELFSENGTVYLVAGYFSRSGYHQMEESMKDFLERNAKNKIVVIIGTEPNQFSATIAYELWQMDEEKPGSVELLKFNDTFLHTKHYVRKNDAPAVILGSANFTGEGFGKHLELVSYYETSESDDSVANQHIAWFEDLIPECSQVTEEDLEEYRKKRIEIETIEDDEILEELGVSLSELREKLEDPDSFGSYRVNLLSRYLEVEDTSRATIAVKSRIEKYPHQIIGGSQAYRNLSYNGFYLLADEVGLGKTYEAGLALKQLKFAGKVDRALVVCNSSAMRDWEEALEKFYEDPTLITSSRKSDWKSAGFSESDIWEKDELMICTPEMFRQAVLDGETGEEDWDMVILDEAHVVKNNDSKIHGVVRDLDVKYKLFLTATPVQNQEKEFYNLFDAMEQNFLGSSYESYKTKGENYLRDLLQGENESFLTRFLREELPYMEIPPRDVRDRFVDLSPEESEVNNTFLDFLADLVDRNEHTAAHLVAVTYQKIAASSWFSLESSMKKLRAKHEDEDTKEVSLSEFEDSFDDEGQTQLVDDDEETLEVDLGLLDDVIEKLEGLNHENKVEEAVNAVSEIMEHEDRIVIFTQYKRNILPRSRLERDISGMNFLESLKENLEIPVYTYHGSMNTTERYETRERFEETGGVFLTTEAGAESINLQHCNVLMNFDIPWNPARLEQRIGRIQRLGQDKEAVIFNLVLRNTLDESVYNKVVKKHNLLQSRFGSSENVTEQEALKAVESGSVGEIESTSQVFMRALRERRGSEEIKEYFEQEMDERDEELDQLQSRMQDSLKDFDKRIKALLTGEGRDTSEVQEEIEEMTSEYKKLLKEYLTYLRFTEGIDVQFEGDEVVLSGDRNLLGDNKVRAALDGETSLFKDIPLLTPSSGPLDELLDETRTDFSVTQVDDESGFVFDFLVEINSPLNTIERVIRIRVNEDTREVSSSFLKDAERTDEGEIMLEEFISYLHRAHPKAVEEAEELLEQEKNELDSFITSEVSRLRKRQSEETRERIEEEVRQPIQLQEDRVESLKEDVKEGKATGKELESARQDLQNRRANRREKENQIRKEVSSKYEEQIEEVRSQKEQCTSNICLLSACELTG